MRLMVKRGKRDARATVIGSEFVREHRRDWRAPKTRREGRSVSCRSMVYTLKRNRHDLIRVLPPDVDAKLLILQGEIHTLRKEFERVVDEAWRRAKPHVFPCNGCGVAGGHADNCETLT